MFWVLVFAREKGWLDEDPLLLEEKTEVTCQEPQLLISMSLKPQAVRRVGGGLGCRAAEANGLVGGVCFGLFCFFCAKSNGRCMYGIAIEYC